MAPKKQMLIPMIGIRARFRHFAAAEEYEMLTVSYTLGTIAMLLGQMLAVSTLVSSPGGLGVVRCQSNKDHLHKPL